jgi:hypothetical protein
MRLSVSVSPNFHEENIRLFSKTHYSAKVRRDASTEDLQRLQGRLEGRSGWDRGFNEDVRSEEGV